MVIVRFNRWEEFIGELAENQPEDRTLRLTFSLRYDGQAVPHLTMVAGYRCRSMIVEFVEYLGLKPVDSVSQRSTEIRTLFEERRENLVALGYRVKPGRYHVPPALHR